MDVKLTSRVMNDDLFEISSELNKLSYEHKIWHPKDAKGFKEDGSSQKYLWDVLHLDCDWVINIDEDLFISDNSTIIELFHYMIENDIDFCGPPDGGIPSKIHNPVPQNIFFGIFNVKKIREKLDNVSFEEVYSQKMDKDLEHFTPLFILENGYEYRYCDREPYYGMFYWLLRNGFKPLYLEADAGKYKNGNLIDNQTTSIKFNSKTFAYHAWMARKWKQSPKHKKRILKVYNAVKNNEVV